VKFAEPILDDEVSRYIVVETLLTSASNDSERLLLLLSKDLFKRGCESAREGTRFAHGVAVSHFHDAAEITARAAALKIGAPVRPDANFLEYWTKTNEWAEKSQLDIRLRHQAEMGDLNEARKYFKHRGKLMQTEYVRGYQSTTHAFLMDTFESFFSVSFDALTSVSFVRELRIKNALEAAQSALAARDVKLALERCADAWSITASQQRAFFPSEGDRGLLVSYDKQLQAILSVTRGEFATVFDHIHQLARLTFAALLGLNAADIFLLIQTLPVKQGDAYAHPSRVESISHETVAHIIELIAEYSSALLKHIDGFTRPEWMGPAEELQST
jgi:hypothetical protein